MTDFGSRWRNDPMAFIERVLIDPETNKPFVLLPAEREFLKHAFTLDADGHLLYPELIYSCPKKSGKSTFAAIIVITLVLLFGGAYPEAIICANDFEQSIGRVHAMIRRIIEASPLLRREAKFTQTRITLGDAVITAIPSDYASAAGSNQNIAVFDELWGFVSERARRLFDELVAVPTRKIACRLTVTYAGFEGESQLLLGLYQRGLKQPQLGPDLYGGDGILMFWSHEPIAPWQDQRWLAEMERSLRPSQYARMIRNEWVTAESVFIDMQAWDACVDPQLRHILHDKTLPVFAAVDASVKHDSTALVACTWDKLHQQVRLVDHRIYQPSPHQPLNFETTVERTLREWHDRYKLRAVLYDPYQMHAVAGRLQRAGLPMQEFAQTIPNLTQSSQNLFELVKSGNLATYPDPDIRLAVSRAAAIESARGWRIAKEKQSYKIDVVVALGMAALAAVTQGSKPVMRPMIGAAGCDGFGHITWRDMKTGEAIDPKTGEPIRRTHIRVMRIGEKDPPAVRGP
jgi:phage terminase large subunit-like protein